VKKERAIKLYAKPIKLFLESKNIRDLLFWLDKKYIRVIRGKARKDILNLIAFLRIASMDSQREIFLRSLEVAKRYSDYPRLVALTMDLDYMDTNSNPDVRFVTQLSQAKLIKRDFPDQLFLFIGIDPRRFQGMELVKQVKEELLKGVKSTDGKTVRPYCSGIKIYPAHGYFPFDPALDELYKYASEEQIPIIFHCTRIGSQYIGRNIQSRIPFNPEMIMPDSTHPQYAKALGGANQIKERISRYYTKGWVKNNPIGKNEFSCDLFSHPQNYISVLIKYPNLKICLAHMGGSDEVRHMYSDSKHKKKDKSVRKENLLEIWRMDGNNWANLIQDMMIEYKNLYVDVSSTISHFDDPVVIRNTTNWMNQKDKGGELLSTRFLFGTDFFMTEMLAAESELYDMMDQSQFKKFFIADAESNWTKFITKKNGSV
jgi:predicted TIM-barrel fold metal-dependent hydrolase